MDRPGRALLAAVTALVVAAGADRAHPANRSAPTSTLRLALGGDPGTPLVIRGRVLDPHGNGLPGIRVRVYHADSHGAYGRYDSTLVSGRDGGYEVRTIRPASYGGYTAHVHFVVTVGRRNEYLQLEFADDPLRRSGATPKAEIPVLPESLARQFTAPATRRTTTVRPVAIGTDGVHRVERDLVVRP